MVNNCNKMCNVVVPIYKTELSPYEEVSLNRCFEIFCRRSITIVAPRSLDLKKIDFLSKKQIAEIRFDDEYFTSTSSYNRLLLQSEFYDCFSEFDFILIYQLDAFVFADELTAWCNAGFDYIGAPWIRDVIEEYKLARLLPFWVRWKRKNRQPKKCLVGNGGFSLRKVATFRKVLRYFKYFSNKWPSQEDVFWSCAAPSLYPWFKIPDKAIAMKFAFELEPSVCYEINQKRLPFGCHAWERHDIDFWRPIFATMNYFI